MKGNSASPCGSQLRDQINQAMVNRDLECLGADSSCPLGDSTPLKDFGKIGRSLGNRGVNACKGVFDSESGSGVESRANAERSAVEGSTSR